MRGIVPVSYWTLAQESSNLPLVSPFDASVPPTI
ncbi:MAG: hypothetical protein UZ13_02661 [Chloroflexi bacterium OLB13]|jgi:hypothetical protein|nr:MAG: hypothetical protein UZ13_02661 [Chloroflexi bacterium OLB13]